MCTRQSEQETFTTHARALWPDSFRLALAAITASNVAMRVKKRDAKHLRFNLPIV